ncbi:MAG: DNA-processing protein DprA [Clostridia bacterium]|nr:DNA-processing protein DprA [Clostridia bacterium]
MNDLKYWIWFSRLENLTPKNLVKLLKRFENPKNIFNKTKQQLLLEGIKEKIVEEIINPKYKENLNNYIKYMQKNNIDIITIYDNEYPYNLKQIYDPPIVLYTKGNKQILKQKGLAIIGCRLCTTYGKNIAKKLAYNLSLNNINIISGLAKGIDSFAHIGALQAKGKTIAVVGCGLDSVYPKENTQLFNEIIKSNGVIVSEYIVGTKPIANNFPRRNRIISGLSDGIIVVEARQKSGTLITTDFALEQGKEIYAVPGNINSSSSYGTNELIKQGAKVLTKVEDILEDLL